MASEGEGSVCCVCNGGHSHGKVCRICQEESRAANLHPSYGGGSRISTNSPQQEKMSQQPPVRNGGVGEEETYSMMMRVNLDILACYKANFRARPMKDAKGRIADALEEPVSEMRAAAGKALDAAIEKVKKEDLASSGTINGLVSRIAELSTKFAEVRNVRNLSERLEDLQMAVATWKWLRSLLTDAEELRTAMKQMSPLPITQMRLSDQLSEINQRINDINLVVVDETVLLPRSSRSSTQCIIKN
ncbi:hypothetical protein TSMEX_004985 [Taenia solium]|eukprot:TsM_000869500 transcript=TsM_000869500 gene=TsM_000869500